MGVDAPRSAHVRTGQNPRDYFLLSWPERVIAVWAAKRVEKVQGRAAFTLAAGYMVVGAFWTTAAGLLFLIWLPVGLLGVQGWPIHMIAGSGVIVLVIGLARYVQCRRAMVQERQMRGRTESE